MKKTRSMKKYFIYIPLFIFTILNYISIFVLNSFIEKSTTKGILSVITIVLFVLVIYFNKVKYSKLYKLFLVALIIMSIYITLNSVLYLYGLKDVFSSASNFKNYILQSGSYGIFVFILIQFLQVIFLPVPSMMITLAGVAIYGPIVASIIVSTGILIGSICSFYVGKTFGVRVVEWIAGVDNTRKYSQILEKKGKFFLSVAFLLPLFPDDILCLIAGITSMKFKSFLIITLITRPISVIFMSFFGGGFIIPFRGWGLYVWPFILVFVIFAVVFIYKHQEKIEEILFKKIFKLRKVNQQEYVEI